MLLKFVLPKPEGAVAAAERVLFEAARAARRLTPMQVIKLTYISHGWMLALRDRPLFGEAVEAWEHGPVIPAVYGEYMKYGGGPVKVEGDEHTVMEREKQDMVEQVFRRYGHMHAFQLSGLTHQKGSPWHITRQQGGKVIPNELIQTHYMRLERHLRAQKEGGTE